jgi:hypothetical protein
MFLVVCMLAATLVPRHRAAVEAHQRERHLEPAPEAG